MTSQWIDAAAVAAQIGADRATVYRMVKRGAFPAPTHFMPRFVRWDSGSVAGWVADHPGWSPRAGRPYKTATLP